MDRVEAANVECAGFYEIIMDAEADAAKESKPATAGRTPREERAPEIKGVATALKPDELTSSVAAQDISLWVEQWTEFKENSSFSKLGVASIIAYLKTCVSHDILAAIDYKQLKTDKEMLDKIMDYLNTKVHPTVIRQLEIW